MRAWQRVCVRGSAGGVGEWTLELSGEESLAGADAAEEEQLHHRGLLHVDPTTTAAEHGG